MDNPSKIDRRKIIFIIVGGFVAANIILFYLFLKSTERRSGIQPFPPPPGLLQVMEISGWVSDVNVSDNSFTMTSRKNEAYEVFLGKKTELKEYAVSDPLFFQVSPNAPLEQTVRTTLQKMKKGDQVAITASSPIYSGEAIKEPVEVQVFR